MYDDFGSWVLAGLYEFLAWTSDIKIALIDVLISVCEWICSVLDAILARLEKR